MIIKMKSYKSSDSGLKCNFAYVWVLMGEPLRA